MTETVVLLTENFDFQTSIMGVEPWKHKREIGAMGVLGGTGFTSLGIVNLLWGGASRYF